MGLLDDAIRQHLELKRKHGVTEQELQRQEEEALGPARRDVASAGTPDGVGASEAAEAADAGGEPLRQEPAPEPPAPEPPGEEGPFVDEPEAAAAADRGAEAGDQALEPKADHPPADPAFDPAPSEAVSAPAGDTPPRGVEALDDADARDEDGSTVGEDGDVLEDTPDFLQETPEHDRLWFEQKPPRDFDFD